MSTTGKPTLLVDNLFGGSGLFLLQQSRIMGSGKPVDWVSSSRDADLVASARQFASLKQGRSAAEVVAAMHPYYVLRMLGGMLYLAGMIVMAINVYLTIKGRIRNERPLVQVATHLSPAE